ncbi:hypothetical protein EC915_104192 [Pseudomonas sp. LP_7_YM]|nr:hypothetical protein EC915_104192 [Pseudomonas sp. LP_7_YM]
MGFTFIPHNFHEHHPMKHPLIAFTFCFLASGAFAMPASEEPLLGGLHDTRQSDLPVFAQHSSSRLIHQRVADNGPDRLVQQYQRVS